MRTKWITGILPVFFLILLPFLARSQKTVGQQPPHCEQDLFCLFNQEAEASDSAAIRKYSHDLIELIVPSEAGKDYIDSLSDRLAKAESAARNEQGGLVSEADIERSFNELVRTIGAPSAFTADVASVRKFRIRSATVPSLSALFTANRNDANCNPGEAVFLLFLLIENNGSLSEHMFDEYTSRAGTNGQQEEFSVLTGRMESSNRNAKGMLSDYSSKHRRATTKLFNRVAQILGF